MNKIFSAVILSVVMVSGVRAEAQSDADLVKGIQALIAQRDELVAAREALTQGNTDLEKQKTALNGQVAGLNKDIETKQAELGRLSEKVTTLLTEVTSKNGVLSESSVANSTMSADLKQCQATLEGSKNWLGELEAKIRSEKCPADAKVAGYKALLVAAKENRLPAFVLGASVLALAVLGHVAANACTTTVVEKAE